MRGTAASPVPVVGAGVAPLAELDAVPAQARLAQAEASDARSERAAKPLVEKVDALTTRQRVAEAVRTYLEDLKGQATPPVAPPKTAAALRPRKSKKG